MLVLVVIGVIMYLVNTYIPMAQPMKTIINVVVCIIVLIWVLQIFGLIGVVGDVRVR